MSFFKRSKKISEINKNKNTNTNNINDHKNQDLHTSFILNLEKSNIFTNEGIMSFQKVIKDFHFFNHEGISLKKTINYEPFLSLEDKKQFGINTRIKIGYNFFEMLSEKGKSEENPYDLFNSIYLASWHNVQRKYKLIELKELGTKKVKLSACGDNRDCSKIHKIKKIWAIENVPQLPLPDCDAEYCRCDYQAYFK